MTEPTQVSLGGRGSVSIALYLHDGTPVTAMASLVSQGRTALDHGFDGVTVSEHHAGFRGYIPTPTLAAARILGTTEQGWAAPCPILLPLRHPAIVAEELAWLAAMFPGRVAAGMAAGYSEQDFAVVGLDPAAANRELRKRVTEWRRLVADPRSPLSNDEAVRSVLPSVPLVVCTGGPVGAAHAAHHEMGIMLPPQDPARNAETLTAYSEAGGTGPRLLGQWVWVGRPPEAGLEGLRAAYPAVDAEGKRKYAPEVVHADDPSEIAETLGRDIVRLGLTGINLRIHLPGVGPEATERQIRTVAFELLPLLRAQFALSFNSNTDRAAGTSP
jgi:alkanesulfonate monooxygenase SsuD/methylene tetrahydromethanopterin reductase-like flavin-dependent oxidoreductase (luciferase family)